MRTYEQDPERVRRWKEEEYPAIHAEAAAAGDHVGKIVARTRDKLKDGIEKAINRLQRLPEIVCGFFRDPDLSDIHL